MKRKSIYAAFVLGAMSFNATAWQMHNGWCQQLSDDGQVMVMVKAERAAIFGQKGCNDSYFGNGEAIGLNDAAYPSMGTCNQSTGHKPISVANSPAAAGAIANSIANQERSVVKVFGGSMYVTRGNFVEVCSSVSPTLALQKAQTRGEDTNMGAVVNAAKKEYAAVYGADTLDSADFNTVRELRGETLGSEPVRVFQYEVSNPPYRKYDYVAVFINNAGKVLDTVVSETSR